MEVKDLIMEFISERPKTDVVIGYGSGVKKQANDKNFFKQIDLIVGVNNPVEWHKQNYCLNPTDYSSKLGLKLLPLYQNLGTGVNYLSHIKHGQNTFKIGVVSTNDLYSDLVNWNNFYLAGRFQKPIEPIILNKRIETAIAVNRLNALKVALLSSNRDIITEQELYENLCSLSFIGDWRQILHIENPNKIRNIVNGSFNDFKNIYSNLNDQYYFKNRFDKISINHDKIIDDLYTLPNDLQLKILSKIHHNLNDKDLENIKKTIEHYLRTINIKASAIQPIKGLALNGISKSKVYLKQKLEKR